MAAPIAHLQPNIRAHSVGKAGSLRAHGLVLHMIAHPLSVWQNGFLACRKIKSKNNFAVTKKCINFATAYKERAFRRLLSKVMTR